VPFKANKTRGSMALLGSSESKSRIGLEPLSHPAVTTGVIAAESTREKLQRELLVKKKEERKQRAARKSAKGQQEQVDLQLKLQVHNESDTHETNGVHDLISSSETSSNSTIPSTEHTPEKHFEEPQEEQLVDHKVKKTVKQKSKKIRSSGEGNMDNKVDQLNLDSARSSNTSVTSEEALSEAKVQEDHDYSHKMSSKPSKKKSKNKVFVGKNEGENVNSHVSIPPLDSFMDVPQSDESLPPPQVDENLMSVATDHQNHKTKDGPTLDLTILLSPKQVEDKVPSTVESARKKQEEYFKSIEMEEAAVQVQCVYRGYIGRKEAQKRREEIEQEIHEEALRELQEESCVKIQATFKGYMVRKRDFFSKTQRLKVAKAQKRAKELKQRQEKDRLQNILQHNLNLNENINVGVISSKQDDKEKEIGHYASCSSNSNSSIESENESDNERDVGRDTKDSVKQNEKSTDKNRVPTPPTSARPATGNISPVRRIKTSERSSVEEIPDPTRNITPFDGDGTAPTGDDERTKIHVWPVEYNMEPSDGWNDLNQLDNLTRQSQSDRMLACGQLRVFCGTWNLEAKKPTENLREWISRNKFHIIAVGTEECVNSIAKSVVFSSKKQWEDQLKESIGEEYVKVASHSLTAIHNIVFIHESLLPFLSNVQSDAVATGIGNQIGNKGGIGISFSIGKTSFAFVSSHFEAHQHHLEKRNNNFFRINRELQLIPGRFSNTTSSNTNGGGMHLAGSGAAAAAAIAHAASTGLSTIQLAKLPVSECFDRVFWYGDLNYRINGTRKMVDTLLVRNMHSVLYFNDQLRIEMEKGHVFNVSFFIEHLTTVLEISHFVVCLLLKAFQGRSSTFPTHI
jgi:hypothetical protein